MPDDITLTAETEGVDEAAEALRELADAAERANEALDDLSVRVSAPDGGQFGEGIKAELHDSERSHRG